MKRHDSSFPIAMAAWNRRRRGCVIPNDWPILSGLSVAYAWKAALDNNGFKHWLYRNGRQSTAARLINLPSLLVGKLGLAPNWLVTLEVTGRMSGKPISMPLVMTLFHGERYLVAMLGNNSPWVHNVHAAGGKAVLCRGRREAVRLEDEPVEQRAPILKAYLQRAPGARPHIPVNKDAPLADFERIAPDYPVFRVRPA
jgi:hypothetical protein